MHPHSHTASRFPWTGKATAFAVMAIAIAGTPHPALAKRPAPPPSVAMASPARLAFNAAGDLLVSDQTLDMVLTVDAATLQVQGGFAVGGRPLGIASTGRGSKTRIYVGNATAKRVQVYDRDGQWMYNLGERDDYTWQPNDIAVDEKRELVFVVDGWRKVLKVYSSAGLLLRTIPGAYPDPAVLANPTAVAVDTNRQEIFVSDYGDPAAYVKPRIQVFAYDGTLLREISGKQGMFGQRFSRPQGLAVDTEGHVFLVDCVAGEVLSFDGVTGTLLKTLGNFGPGPGQLQFPLDVVIAERSRDIFVTNNQQHRIEVFPGGGVLP